MNNILRNTVLAIVALAAISMLALNFSGAATTTSTAPARHYYLTKAAFNGNQALTACASGYHFASFAELFDPGVITYNKTLGRSQADDGAGPPVGEGAIGWVRTGYISNSNPEGSFPTNCSVWTSGATSDDGEGGSFSPTNGVTNSGPVFVVFDNVACDNSQGFNAGVWCVEN
jgi:hypothetical protein